MRKLLLTVAIMAIAIPAMAQQPSSPANRNANTPAVNTPNSPPNPGAPVAGANSFTEGQAKSRIEAHGFTSVGQLKKDRDGVAIAVRFLILLADQKFRCTRSCSSTVF